MKEYVRNQLNNKSNKVTDEHRGKLLESWNILEAQFESLKFVPDVYKQLFKKQQKYMNLNKLFDFEIYDVTEGDRETIKILQIPNAEFLKSHSLSAIMNDDNIRRTMSLDTEKTNSDDSSGPTQNFLNNF